MATVALLSAPRIVSPALSHAPSTSTGSTAPSCGAVAGGGRGSPERSRRPGSRASRWPVSPPISRAASSSSTSRPSERSSWATRSPMARSCPKGLGIAQSSANVSFRRRSSTSEAGRIGDRVVVGRGRRSGWTVGRAVGAGAASGGARRAHDVALGGALPGALQRGLDELAEERRRALGPGLELRMELGGDEERVVAQFDDLDEALVGRRAGDDEPGRLEALAQGDRHLVAMAVALVDDRLAVRLARAGVGVELDRVGAEAHGAA